MLAITQYFETIIFAMNVARPPVPMLEIYTYGITALLVCKCANVHTERIRDQAKTIAAGVVKPRRLDCHSVAELVSYAVRNNLIEA
jgi:hypothetical protein